MNWSITKLRVISESNGLSDVVVAASYKIGSINGTVTVKPPGASFTTFADLTEAQVLDWVWAEVDKAGVEARAQAALVLPPVSVEMPLPWSN